MTRLSRFLSSRRDAAGLSTAKVHRACVERGIDLSYTAVFRWFSGDSRSDVGQLYTLGLILGWSALEFLHACRLAGDDLVVGEAETPFEPDPSVAPTEEAA